MFSFYLICREKFSNEFICTYLELKVLRTSLMRQTNFIADLNTNKPRFTSEQVFELPSSIRPFAFPCKVVTPNLNRSNEQKTLNFGIYHIFPQVIHIFMAQIWVLNSCCGLAASTISLKIVFAKLMKS